MYELKISVVFKNLTEKEILVFKEMRKELIKDLQESFGTEKDRVHTSSVEVLEVDL
jgi:hypothetical protein